MELLPLCLCLVALSGSTFADGNGPVFIRVNEGDNATLPCNINMDIESVRFDWTKDGEKDVYVYERTEYTDVHPQFIGRVSHLGNEKLQKGSASITIRNIDVRDKGVYTCIFPKLEPKQTFTVHLVVGCMRLKNRSGEFPGKVAKLYTKKLPKTKDGVMLQCLVTYASPYLKTNISWYDSSGNKLKDSQLEEIENGELYILETTVTKSDTYRCYATIEELCHQVSGNATVTDDDLKDKTTEDDRTARVKGSSGLRVSPCLITVVLFLGLLVTVG